MIDPNNNRNYNYNTFEINWTSKFQDSRVNAKIITETIMQN